MYRSRGHSESKPAITFNFLLSFLLIFVIYLKASISVSTKVQSEFSYFGFIFQYLLSDFLVG